MSFYVDPLEKMLAESNKEDVGLIADGLSKQHFIEIDSFTLPKGPLYESHLLNDTWAENRYMLINIKYLICCFSAKNKFY